MTTKEQSWHDDYAPCATPNPALDGNVTTPIRLYHVLMLGGLTAFGPLATDLYLPALPAVSQELQAPMALTQLTLTLCILGLALGQLVVGPLSDARGRRWPLLIGLTLFTALSVLCSLAPTVELLMGLRLLQGLAGATGIVIALAIARDLYTGKTLARAIALLMTVNFLAPIAAPLLGGQLLRLVSWRGVFAAIGLIGFLFVLGVAYTLGETLPPAQRQKGDGKTMLRTMRTLLRDGHFLGYALTCGFAFTCGIVYISASPFVLQTIYGLTPQQFSLVFAGNAVGLTLMSQLSALLVNRWTPHTLVVTGVVALSAATVTLLVGVLVGISLWGFLAACFVMVASLGLIAPNATALALADRDPQTAGTASAFLGLLQLGIGALIAPLVGLWGRTTALPMATVIALFGMAALLVTLASSRRTTTDRDRNG